MNDREARARKKRKWPTIEIHSTPAINKRNAIPALVSALWTRGVMRRIRGESALAAMNKPTVASEPCAACGRRWDQHFGEGPCPWWQG